MNELPESARRTCSTGACCRSWRSSACARWPRWPTRCSAAARSTPHAVGRGPVTPRPVTPGAIAVTEPANTDQGGRRDDQRQRGTAPGRRARPVHTAARAERRAPTARQHRRPASSSSRQPRGSSGNRPAAPRKAATDDARTKPSRPSRSRRPSTTSRSCSASIPPAPRPARPDPLQEPQAAHAAALRQAAADGLPGRDARQERDLHARRRSRSCAAAAPACPAPRSARRSTSSRARPSSSNTSRRAARRSIYELRVVRIASSKASTARARGLPAESQGRPDAAAPRPAWQRLPLPALLRAAGRARVSPATPASRPARTRRLDARSAAAAERPANKLGAWRSV